MLDKLTGEVYVMFEGSLMKYIWWLTRWLLKYIFYLKADWWIKFDVWKLTDEIFLMVDKLTLKYILYLKTDWWIIFDVWQADWWNICVLLYNRNVKNIWYFLNTGWRNLFDFQWKPYFFFCNNRQLQHIWFCVKADWWNIFEIVRQETNICYPPNSRRKMSGTRARTPV